MTGPVTPEARTMGPPGATCAQCRRFDSSPGDETAGRCLNQPWDHAQHGTIYGLAFAREGADGCDGYAPREGAPPAIPDLRPDPDAEDDVAASRDPIPSQRAGKPADATAPTPAAALAKSEDSSSSCGACSAMREMLIACAEALELEGVGCGGSRECGDDPCTACRARALSSGVLR